MSAPDRQLRFAFDEPPARPAPPARFVRNPRARRYILRLLPDGTPRVTIPSRGSVRQAQAFLASQEAWLSREQARLAACERPRRPAAWREGDRVLVSGRPVTLRRSPGGAIGGLNPSDELHLTVPASATDDLKPAAVRWLWQLARRELPARLQQLAVRFGLSVTAVSIRNQRSRWGSCATTGRISLNWRLVQTPPAVRDYVLVHELMHLRQPNHSRRFWRLVAAACPDFQSARQWLRAHEAELLDGR